MSHENPIWVAKIRYESRKSDMSRENPIWVAKIRYETRKSDLGNEKAKNAKVSFSATILMGTNMTWQIDYLWFGRQLGWDQRGECLSSCIYSLSDLSTVHWETWQNLETLINSERSRHPWVLAMHVLVLRPTMIQHYCICYHHRGISSYVLLFKFNILTYTRTQFYSAYKHTSMWVCTDAFLLHNSNILSGLQNYKKGSIFILEKDKNGYFCNHKFFSQLKQKNTSHYLLQKINTNNKSVKYFFNV